MDDPRVWARGKTGPEVVAIAGQLEGVVQRYVTTGSQAPAPTGNPTGNGNGANNGFAEGEYVSGSELNRQAPRLIAEGIAPHIAQMNEQLAGMALDRVKDQFRDEFARYGPEIYGHLSTLDKKSGVWTVDNLTRVVKLVRADHVDEIVRDKLNASSPMEPALRSTGAAPIPVVPPSQIDVSVKSEQIPSDYRDKLAKAGITDATMDEFCRANNMTRESFIQMIAKNQTITEAPRR